MKKRILIASVLGFLMCYVGLGAIFGRTNDSNLRTALESVLAKSHEVIPISPFRRHESLT
jgi:hypothetical protein